MYKIKQSLLAFGQFHGDLGHPPAAPVAGLIRPGSGEYNNAPHGNFNVVNLRPARSWCAMWTA